MRLNIVAALLLLLSYGAAVRAEQWERLGPAGGMVVALGTDTGSDVYLGTADGHVFASKDAAESWDLRGRVGSRLDAVVTRLVTDPRDSAHVYAALWYQEAGAGGGVYGSQDGGRTWALLGLQGEVVRALEIAPSQPEDLVAGTRSGVFRSRNQGKQWTRISPVGDQELRNVDSIAIDPRAPDVIYAGTYHLPWRTLDGGKSWEPVARGIIDDSDIMSLRVDAANPERVYLSACSGIYRSENRGAAWTKLQGIPYPARRTQVIAQDSNDPKTLYAGTTEGLWITRDGGESWARATPKDWVVNSVAVVGAANGGRGRIVLGTEGQGVEVSDDAGVSFAESNRGFSHVVVIRLLAARNNTEHLLMIVGRNGWEVLESGDSGKNWAPVSLATLQRGAATTLKADSIQEIYASPWGWLLRLADGKLWLREEENHTWREWKLRLPLSKGKTGTHRSRAPAAASPGVTGAVLAFSADAGVVPTAEGLLQCLGTGLCRPLRAFGSRGQVRALWLSANGREIAAAVDGKLGSSADGGETATWRDLPVANEQARWLDVAASGPVTAVYLGTSRGLFISRDLGVRWQRVETGLPAGSAEQWLRQPELLALTERDGGMYLSQDEGLTWQRVDQDAERGRVTGLLGLRNGAVLAGSESEGLLRFSPTNSPGLQGKH